MLKELLQSLLSQVEDYAATIRETVEANLSPNNNRAVYEFNSTLLCIDDLAMQLEQLVLLCKDKLKQIVPAPTEESPEDDVDQRVVTLIGTGGRIANGPASLHARLAGTTSRFVTALAALGSGPTTIDGDPPLRTRPMTPLHAALAALQASQNLRAVDCATIDRASISSST